MKIPESVLMVQELIERHGLAVLLQLVAANCKDRAVLWEKQTEIVQEAAQRVKSLEPEARNGQMSV